ncbi:60S ribosomal export protein NMD3 [Halanaeroarchaeum sulfurireducens]|uniref:NMD3 family protein n=1 Tax=Halanaeroarchaeum sulfurireducens TaxID=1604004 RepID=A0A0N9N5L6_9EURY|nr:60S ribosomal export protein NMD3 [Halanaeroarchaeum sulfurireducens]ALG83001.1 NMD3 family protein [Halanaeroarchaeum sulfurireducens]
MTAESGTFCPRCGDPVERPTGADRRGTGESGTTRRERMLCTACYLEEFDLVDVPDRVQVDVCARCGAVHRGNRWVDVGAKDYTDVAVDAVTEALGVHVQAEDVAWEVTPEQVDQTNIRMHATFTGTVRGEEVTESVTVPVTIAKGICTRCGRISGDYYASLVQVRADGRDPTAEETERAVEIANEVVAEMEATGDRNAFITEVSETRGGLDMKLSTNKIGKKVARNLVTEFGGRVEDSETLVTEDEDGNEVYRVTYAVHLPRYHPGDVVDLDGDGGPVLVRSVKGNLKGVRVTTGEPYEASYEEGNAPDGRVVGTRTDAEETTVVAIEDENAVQIIDPETYESRTVARPAYFDADADVVPTLKSRAGLHILPGN